MNILNDLIKLSTGQLNTVIVNLHKTLTQEFFTLTDRISYLEM